MLGRMEVRDVGLLNNQRTSSIERIIISMCFSQHLVASGAATPKDLKRQLLIMSLETWGFGVSMLHSLEIAPPQVSGAYDNAKVSRR